MAALFSPLLIYLEQGSVFLYNARLVSPVMPSNRHSYTVLAAACACVLAVCAFLFWQNRQKKNKLARQYAELSMPPPAQGGTPAQQKALLEILSGKREAVSQENLLFPETRDAAPLHRKKTEGPPPRSREKIFSTPPGHARVARDESCRFRPVADPSGKGRADLQTPEGAGLSAGTENAPPAPDGGHQAEGPGRQAGSRER